MSRATWRSGKAGAGYWGDQAAASPARVTFLEQQGCGKRKGMGKKEQKRKGKEEKREERKGQE